MLYILALKSRFSVNFNIELLFQGQRQLDEATKQQTLISNLQRQGTNR